MRRMLALAACSTLLLLGGSALAQPAGGGSSSGDPRTRPPERYDFEGDVISSTRIRPEGDFLTGRKDPRLPGLIELRADFVEELLESASEL